MTVLDNDGGSHERTRWTRAWCVAALALLAGAAYLAVTRADALMLDIARIAACF